MADFGDLTVSQTTLASMFPISFEFFRSTLMSKRTPQPFAPLAPEKVRPLFLTAFSLNYTGYIKITDLNTELLFLARALCAPTQSVAGGIGAVPGEALMIDVTFNDVTLDDVAVPLVIQGLNLTGSLTFSGTLTSFGIVQIGFCNIAKDLLFGPEVTVASLEIYSCGVSTGQLVLPTGSAMTSLLIYGQYPQVSLQAVSDRKVYPILSSLMYLNGVDGQGPRDIPSGARGFGAFTLSGLTQPSYPSVTTLATVDPWSTGVDIEALFPNLISLIVLGYPHSGPLTIPATPISRYSSLTFIDAAQVTGINLSDRAASLSVGIRIVGCPKLSAVMTRRESSAPDYEYRTFIIERCALLFLRRGRVTGGSTTTLRLGDQTGLAISVTTTGSYSRLLDFILAAVPTIMIVDDGQTALPAVASDYLPNVLVALAERAPTLIQYPMMQTVEYQFAQSSPHTQYSGGANPVLPSAGSRLTSASITVSPFGIRYLFKNSSVSSIGETISNLSSTAVAETKTITGGRLSTFRRAFPHGKTKWLILGAIIVGIILIIVAIILIIMKSRSLSHRPSTNKEEEVKPHLKK